MNTKMVLLAALLAGAFSPVMADEGGQPVAAEPRVITRVPEGGQAVAAEPRVITRVPDGDRLAMMPFDGMSMPLLHRQGKPVKNAPYTAEAVSERQHTLSDGNQIINKSSSMSYRDSAGRTRQELRDSKGELRTITIHDPVAGSTVILHPQDKTATRITVNKEMAQAARDSARARIEQLRKEGKLPAADGGGRMIVKRVERVDSELRKQIHEDVRIKLADRLGDGRSGPGIGADIGTAFGDMKWAAKASTRELAQKEIDGVNAEGKLRSYEIPAGEVGNRKPIVVSDETWFSPELQITLLTKHSDPRTGDRVYRLEGLKREEPAAALFSVPSDYTVKDEMARVKRLEKQEAK